MMALSCHYHRDLQRNTNRIKRSEGKIQASVPTSACSEPKIEVSANRKSQSTICLSALYPPTPLSDDDDFFSKHPSKRLRHQRRAVATNQRTLQLLLDECHRTDEVWWCVVIVSTTHGTELDDTDSERRLRERPSSKVS